MINWFRSLMCRHKWDLYESTIYYDPDDMRLPTRKTVTYLCSKCASSRKVKV